MQLVLGARPGILKRLARAGRPFLSPAFLTFSLSRRDDDGCVGAAEGGGLYIKAKSRLVFNRRRLGFVIALWDRVRLVAGKSRIYTVDSHDPLLLIWAVGWGC